MRVIGQATELGPGDGMPAIAVGMFDGVHLGHQQVLQAAVTEATRAGSRSVAITFDRHPSAVVAPQRQPLLIYSLPQRLRAIAELGLDVAWVIRFDRAFSQQHGEEFIRKTRADFGGIASICIGENFTFGYKRSGNVQLLDRLGTELGFAVRALPAVQFAGQPISSTRIRKSIQAGNFELTADLLGRRYSIGGTVLRGDQLGRQLGFPTANLNVAGLVVPPSGVYAGHAQLENRALPALMNLGYRPTLKRPQPELRAEVHLLDFAGDIYGQELTFGPTRLLRSERKFDSLDSLKAQIARDTAQAREVLAESGRSAPNEWPSTKQS